MKTEMKDFQEINDLLRQESAEVEREKEQVQARHELLEAMRCVMEQAERIQDESQELRDELEQKERDYQRLLNQVEELKAENAELKLQLEELGKVTGKVAEQAEHEDLMRVLRRFIKASRRKNLQKRTAVKSVIMEMTVSTGLSLTDEIMQLLDSLDDEEEKPIQPTIGTVVMEQNNLAPVQGQKLIGGRNDD